MSSKDKTMENNWIKVEDLKEGEWFRLRGGNNDLRFFKTEPNIDGIKRSRPWCFNTDGKVRSFVRHPFTLVIKVEPPKPSQP